MFTFGLIVLTYLGCGVVVAILMHWVRHELTHEDVVLGACLWPAFLIMGVVMMPLALLHLIIGVIMPRLPHDKGYR